MFRLLGSISIGKREIIAGKRGRGGGGVGECLLRTWQGQFGMFEEMEG